MWTELCLAYEGPSDTRDTKIAALRLKFNAFKALKGEKVNGLIDDIYASETQRFTIQASSSKALIPNIHSQDNDLDVEEDKRTSNEFMADLNAQYHERALLANPNHSSSFLELIESIVWAHNKLKVAPATQPRALSIVQGRAVGVTHYLLGGIATTWAFFLARIIAVG
ncbi:retrovirus-related pol polyprotein from transposon TNT 1-94 [Tanacetum coccineum]